MERKFMIKKDLSVKINFRLPKEDFDYLCELSDYNGISVSEIIRQIINIYHRKDFEDED